MTGKGSKTLHEQEVIRIISDNVTIRAQIRSKRIFHLRSGHQNVQSGPECVTRPIQLYLPINTYQTHYPDKAQHIGVFSKFLKSGFNLEGFETFIAIFTCSG